MLVLVLLLEKAIKPSFQSVLDGSNDDEKTWGRQQAQRRGRAKSNLSAAYSAHGASRTTRTSRGRFGCGYNPLGNRRTPTDLGDGYTSEASPQTSEIQG